MSNNALVCILVSAMLSACVACSLSVDIAQIRKTQIESTERLEMIKHIAKP